MGLCCFGSKTPREEPPRDLMMRGIDDPTDDDLLCHEEMPPFHAPIFANAFAAPTRMTRTAPARRAVARLGEFLLPERVTTPMTPAVRGMQYLPPALRAKHQDPREQRVANIHPRKRAASISVTGPVYSSVLNCTFQAQGIHRCVSL